MRCCSGLVIVFALGLACSGDDAERDVAGLAGAPGNDNLPSKSESSGAADGATPLPSSDDGAASAGGEAAPATGAASTGGDEVAGDATAAGGMDGSAASAGEGAPAPAETPASAPPSGSLRILAVGDSITRATCWRAALFQQLEQGFAGRFDFVGTLSSDSGCSPAGYDLDNQGYSSSLVTEIAAGITTARTCDPFCPTLDDLRQAFAAAQPDVVLMHFGTNDVWNGRSAESITSAYTSVVEAARAANPNVRILVAQIIPMNVTEATCAGCTCANCASDVPALNERISAWAAAASTAASLISVVDQFSGYDASADNRDGVHPNDSGSQKMASRWYEALAPLF